MWVYGHCWWSGPCASLATKMKFVRSEVNPGKDWEYLGSVRLSYDARNRRVMSFFAYNQTAAYALSHELWALRVDIEGRL